jgi:hypothetical protein
VDFEQQIGDLIREAVGMNQGEVVTVIKFLYDPILKASTCTITTLKALDSSPNEGPTD